MGFFWTGQYCVLEFHLLVYFFAGQQERFFFTGMVGIVGDEDGISCPWLKGWISRRWRIPSCACRSRQFHSSLFSAGHRRSLCGTSNQINNRSKCHSKLLLRLKSFVLSVDPDAFLCRIHIEGFPHYALTKTGRYSTLTTFHVLLPLRAVKVNQKEKIIFLGFRI